MLKYLFISLSLFLTVQTQASMCSNFIGKDSNTLLSLISQENSYADPSLRFTVNQKSGTPNLLKEVNLTLPTEKTPLNETLLGTFRSAFDARVIPVLDAIHATGNYYSLSQSGIIGFIRTQDPSKKVTFVFWEGHGNNVEKFVKVQGQVTTTKTVSGRPTATKSVEQYDHLVLTFKEAESGAVSEVKVPSVFLNPQFRTVSPPRTETRDGETHYVGYHWGILIGVDK